MGMVRSRFKLVCLLGLASASVYPGAAFADAPRDITGSLRLWLDGLDVNATDTGNGGGTSPAPGAQVTLWKDKSGNGYVAGDATSFGSTLRFYPTYYFNGSGVWFNANHVLEIPGGLYGGLGAISQSEVFMVAGSSPFGDNYAFYNGPVGSSPNRISVSLPAGDGQITWDHGAVGSPGRVQTPWSGSAADQLYIYNFGATSGSSQSIIRNGTSLVSAANAVSYTQASGDTFFIGGAEPGNNYFHNGVISDVIVYARRLKSAERNILSSYLAAKHGNPGGAGTMNKYTVTNGYRYFVGGIGQESDGSLTTGSSAGLYMTNGNFLGSGRYLLAGVNSLNPATGGTTTDVPAGYPMRTQRQWYMTRTGGGAGTVTMVLNAAQLGIAPYIGSQAALIYRSGTTGSFSVLATTNIAFISGTATTPGGVSASFTVSNPQSGYYALAYAGSTTPDIAATLTSTVSSDSINASNPKAVPGAVVRYLSAISNRGTGSPDANSVAFSMTVPANMKLFVGDLISAGSGPVQFTQGSVSSGMSYTYTSLSSTTDSLEFSNNNGASWTYTPTPDAQQGDIAVTNMRIKPTGTFANGTSPNFPSFTVTYGLIVR